MFRTVDMLLERFERDVMLYMMEDEELRTHPSVVEILVGGHVGSVLLPPRSSTRACFNLAVPFIPMLCSSGVHS